MTGDTSTQELVARQLASVIHAARIAGPYETSEPETEKSLQNAKKEFERIVADALERGEPNGEGECSPDALRPATAGSETLSVSPSLKFSALAWLGQWRDKMPAEAVVALQDILGPLSAERGEPPRRDEEPSHD